MEFSLQSCPMADSMTPLWLQLSDLDLDPTATECTYQSASVLVLGNYIAQRWEECFTHRCLPSSNPERWTCDFR
jgi:hypothetical protein